MEQGSSPFEMKWRESISWYRLNIIDQEYCTWSNMLFKILNDMTVCTLLDPGNKI